MSLLFKKSLFGYCFLLLFFTHSIEAKTSEKSKKEVIVNEGTVHQATLYKNNNHVKLKHRNKVIQFDIDSEMFDNSHNYDMELLDVNFDGVDDIAVVSGIGYSGVNLFYTLILSTPKGYQLYEGDQQFSNIEVKPESKILLSGYKSGPRYFYDIFRFEKGRFERFASYENYSEEFDNCRLNELYGDKSNRIVSCVDLIQLQKITPAFAQVKVKKALLYDAEDDDSSNGMYLVKNDWVTLESEVVTDDQKILIGFQGKKYIKKYISRKSLSFLGKANLSRIYTNTHKIYFQSNEVRTSEKVKDELLLKPLNKTSKESHYYFKVSTVTNHAHMCDFSGIAIKRKELIVAKQGDCVIEFQQHKDKSFSLNDKGSMCRKRCGHNARIDGIRFKLKLNQEEKLQAKLEPYLQQGFAILNTTFGDLNNDAYIDAIVVLKHQDEEKINKDKARPLMLFLGQVDGDFKLHKRNDKLVDCFRCGGAMGDPFQDIVIKKGYFSLEYYGGSAWRWSKVVTFRYNKEQKDWFLHRIGEHYFNASDPEKVTKKMKTNKDFGVLPFDKVDMGKVEID